MRPVPGRDATRSGRRSRTASTTTSSCRSRCRPTICRGSRNGCARWSRPTSRSSARRSRARTRWRASPTSRSRSRSSRAWMPTRRGEVGGGDTVTLYRNDGWADLCLGPHVPSTGRLGAFKLTTVAGAYWRGDEQRPMLTRIYGTAWATRRGPRGVPDAPGGGGEARPSQARTAARPLLVAGRARAGSVDLASARRDLPQAARGLRARPAPGPRLRPGRDAAHRAFASCGRPRGTWRSTRTTCTRRCRRTTGDYYVKPMNCPFHVLVYKSQVRSYRDLPMRLSELGTIYRHERLGALHGLLRIRGGTQDDSHIICTPDQLIDEILSGVRADVRDPSRRSGSRIRSSTCRRCPGRRILDEAMAARATEALGRRSTERPAVYGGRQARARSTVRRSTSTSRTRSAALAAHHGAVRLRAARAVRHGVHRRRQRAASSRHGAPRDPRDARAVQRRADRALRGRVPALAVAGAASASSRSPTVTSSTARSLAARAARGRAAAVRRRLEGDRRQEDPRRPS